MLERDAAPPQPDERSPPARASPSGSPVGGLGEQLRGPFEPDRQRVERAHERPQPAEQNRLARSQRSRDAHGVDDDRHAAEP